MKIKRMGKIACASAVAAGCFASVASAAPITWTSSGAVTSDSDVLTTGTLVGAVNMGTPGAVPGGAAQTVNGVNFQADPGRSGPIIFAANPSVSLTAPYTSDDNTFYFSAGQPAPAGASTQYQNILTGNRWSNTTTTADTTTLTLSGLTVGQQYAVQFWSIDERNINTRASVLSGGGGSPITLNRDGTPQWAVGTFTADAITQTIVEAPLHAGDTTQVNAFQIRAVPEPATMGSLALGALGLLIRRRHRHSS